MCKLVSPKDRQLQRLDMSEPTIAITDAELSQAIDEIIGLPNDGASSGEKVQQAMGKIEELQQTLYQVPIQGSSRRPNGKKNKKKSKLPDETLRLNPPQPTLPVKFLVSDPGIKVESLPTYEEMTIDELFNGPSRTWKGRKTIIRIARGKLQR